MAAKKESLDPAFVYDPADPQKFWDNYAYFQAVDQQRKHEELQATVEG